MASKPLLGYFIPSLVIFYVWFWLVHWFMASKPLLGYFIPSLVIFLCLVLVGSLVYGKLTLIALFYSSVSHLFYSKV